MSSITVISDTNLAPELANQVEQVLLPHNGRFINGLPSDRNKMQTQVFSSGEEVKTEDTTDLIAEAEVFYATDMPLERFQAAANLKWIHVPYVGVNRLMSFKEVVESNVIVTNGRGIIAASVADHVMAFILNFARMLPQQWAAQQRQEWGFSQIRNSGLVDELNGQTVGIIGYGEIGREVGKRAKAFGMRVIATRNKADSAAPWLDQTLTTAQLPELLAQSDFVVVTAPLTPATRGMLGAEQFALMKPTAYLINIARGPLLKEAELIEALQAGTIAGAGLDVFEREPLSAESPLWHKPNVLVTPHTAGLFKRLVPRCVEFFCANLTSYLQGEPLKNLVDKKAGY